MRVLMQIRLLAAVIISGLLLVACESPSTVGNAEAEGRTRLDVNNSFGDFGGFVVHINALSTAALTPEVAQTYGITRSEKSALVNLVVLQKVETPAGTEPVKADVSLTAANLTGQLKSANVKEVIDAESIYYISVLSIDDRETINFDFDIQPEGSSQNLRIRFTHKFYER